MEDSQFVVDHAKPPFPKEIGGDKHIIIGPDSSGRRCGRRQSAAPGVRRNCRGRRRWPFR
jgi:hypothetical protein